MSGLPVIDVAPLVRGGATRATAEAIGAACRTFGFFYVAGHGVDPALERSLEEASRRFQAGSRLVAVVSVLRNPQQQINYGSGKPVSDETVADAGEPMRVKWYGDGYLEIPLSR